MFGHDRGIYPAADVESTGKPHKARLRGASEHAEDLVGHRFVERATLNLPNGKRFTVRAVNLSSANGYVGNVTLNGQPLARSYLRHEDILAGGELVFTMQATPNTAWGKDKSARPYTQTAYQ